MAVDGDEQDVLPPGRIVAVDVSAAHEHSVLDRDRRELAGADAEECQPPLVERLLLDLEPVRRLGRLPEPDPRREQEALPGVGPTA